MRAHHIRSNFASNGFLPVLACRQLQKADRNAEAVHAARQTLALHARRVRSLLRGRILRRIKHAEIPTMAVLQRGSAVRIENVTLVQNCFCDLLHSGHAFTGSSKDSSASSHVAMPA